MSGIAGVLGQAIDDSVDAPVVKWVAVVETLTEDGRRLDVYSAGADGTPLMPWDEEGILRYTLEHRDDFAETDDDDDPDDPGA